MTLLIDIKNNLVSVPGIVGIVLGGSRATGTYTDASDYDIGVYYDLERLNMGALQAAVTALDDAQRPDLVAPPGGWGAWVNGGAWVTVAGERVDIILRDIARVGAACADATAGVVTMHYQPGHPHAFLNIMYAGELASAHILWEYGDTLRRLRSSLLPFPMALRNSLVGFFTFEAGFSLQLATKAATSEDAFYAQAHISRSIAALNQVLFAHNGLYCLNEKRAVRRISGMPVSPEAYEQRVHAICTQHDLTQSARLLAALIAETNALVG